ncbi:MAG: hypothetical protein CMJ78_10495 [Planctomycetaceae bacterium]|nr:hypothetical protein [Planctomycetaceae bacterium]
MLHFRSSNFYRAKRRPSAAHAPRVCSTKAPRTNKPWLFACEPSTRVLFALRKILLPRLITHG